MLFVICMAALVAVGIGVLLRVRRHLGQDRTGTEAAAKPQEAIHPETNNEIK